MAQEKRRPALWLAFAVAAFVIVAIWLFNGERLWREPDSGNTDLDTIVQPSSVPPVDTRNLPANPNNSGRDATGDAVARDR